MAGRTGIDTSSRRYIYERLLQEAAGRVRSLASGVDPGSRIQDAYIAGTTVPPLLHRVGFESAKALANNIMKAVGNAPLRCGTINEMSQQVATQEVQSLLDSTTHKERMS